MQSCSDAQSKVRRREIAWHRLAAGAAGRVVDPGPRSVLLEGPPWMFLGYWLQANSHQHCEGRGPSPGYWRRSRKRLVPRLMSAFRRTSSWSVPRTLLPLALLPVTSYSPDEPTNR